MTIIIDKKCKACTYFGIADDLADNFGGKATDYIKAHIKRIEKKNDKA